jgi:hypothetical protein
MQSELETIRDNYRYTDLQRIWHDACFLLGDIGELAYRDQPCQAFLAERLRLVKAIASDLDGDSGNAATGYRTFLAALNPGNSSFSFEEVKAFIAWRLNALA